eukprot:EG_transcript_3265
MYSAVQRLLQSRGLRFNQPEVETQFRDADVRFTISLAYFWILLTFLFMTVGLLVRCNKYGWFQRPDLAFGLYFIPFIVLGFMLAFIHISCLKAHTYYLLWGSNLVLIAWIAVCVHLNTSEDRRVVEDTELAEVFAALQQSGRAHDILHKYLGAELGRKYLWYALIINFIHLDVLQFLNLTWASLSLFVSVPISLGVVSYVSPLLDGVVEVLVMAVILVLYTIGLSCHMVLSRRQQFQTNLELQRTLEKEAAALKEAAEQEAALKKASQEADTILNHLLKNVMADAAGCIHLYLQSLPSNLSTSSTPPADLVQATECLERGVAWCRKRQALMRIATGKYTPQLCDVDLPHFGHSLLQGRPIEAEFPTAVVIMDPLLCEIVLENALTNAHRHGHTTQPAVHFTASLVPLPNNNSPRRRLLKFCVTNRAHPSHPPLTPDRVSRLLRGEERPVGPATSRLSEHLGMQHLSQAARTHNMDLRLFQEGDTVCFEASLEVALPPIASLPRTPSKECVAVVPPNLRVLCIDDSPVARRLLVHTLSRPPMRASVTAFGETADEVPGFLEEALSEADIVILDYHLDYNPVHFLGTDLVRSLQDRGYTGLICIRSANASPFDEALYFRAGAHCCIGKDIHPQAMATTLMAAYLRRQEGQLPQTVLEPSLAGIFQDGSSMDVTDTHCAVHPVEGLPGFSVCLATAN